MIRRSRIIRGQHLRSLDGYDSETKFLPVDNNASTTESTGTEGPPK